MDDMALELTRGDYTAVPVFKVLGKMSGPKEYLVAAWTLDFLVNYVILLSSAYATKLHKPT
jgi:hypothetical protein